jgi:hypothetical protein
MKRPWTPSKLSRHLYSFDLTALFGGAGFIVLIIIMVVVMAMAVSRDKTE